MLEQGDAVLCERNSWSSLAYSSAVQPSLQIQKFTSVDMGLIAPELMVYVDTPPSDIGARSLVSDLFSDPEFRERVYQIYDSPIKWDGVRVLRHHTCDNKWESRTRLMSALKGDSLWSRQFFGKEVAYVPYVTRHWTSKMIIKGGS